MKGKYRIPYYMSTDCEHLVRQFLVVSPAKRTTLEVDVYFTLKLAIAYQNVVLGFRRFYHAMLCIMWTMLLQDVRPSVCHTPVFSRNS